MYEHLSKQESNNKNFKRSTGHREALFKLFQFLYSADNRLLISFLNFSRQYKLIQKGVYFVEMEDNIELEEEEVIIAQKFSYERFPITVDSKCLKTSYLANIAEVFV